MRRPASPVLTRLGRNSVLNLLISAPFPFIPIVTRYYSIR
jgi:hypothetical protein